MKRSYGVFLISFGEESVMSYYSLEFMFRWVKQTHHSHVSPAE